MKNNETERGRVMKWPYFVVIALIPVVVTLVGRNLTQRSMIIQLEENLRECKEYRDAYESVRDDCLEEKNDYQIELMKCLDGRDMSSICEVSGEESK